MLEKYLSRDTFDSYEDYYNNYSVNIPENFNFAWDVMDTIAAERGNDRALVWRDEKGAEAEFTYGDIKRLSDKAAQVFLDAGIGKGDPVMIILKRRHEYWPTLLALHKIGAIAIPATHLLTVKDIVYRVEAADIAGIVCVDDEQVMNRVDEALAKMHSNTARKVSLRYKAFVRSVHSPKEAQPGKAAKSPWADFNFLVEKAPDNFTRPPKVNTNNDTMLLYFTSGTTGMPKMVQHDFAYPLGHIATAKYWHQVVPGGLHLTVSDTGWAKAAWGKIYGQWLCGTAIFVYDYDRFDPPAMLEIISKNRLTTFCAPPTVYRFFIKEDLKKYDFSSLKHCTVAGEPLNPEIFEQFLAGTGLKLHECYGQTELTVTMVTLQWMEPKPGSMGRPSPGYDVDLLREDGSSCDMGEEGQLVVRTDRRRPIGMFHGYYRDEALTKSVWHDDVYHTGDVAWRDEDGYYWFVGRSDDVIKSSGYRIGPFEVESALMEHPAVLECAITGVPDADRGTVVKATVILAKGWSASEELKLELQNHVKKTTAPYKYPRIIEFVSELPKTISGKIRRVQIRAEDTGSADTGGPGLSPD
ncbi:acyl-coenzyme A synthetase ACSM3 [Treponema primitia ZAS-2]|uniref:Acyl-coenzyme A synthetase ACSM3 n=1 Tax=Treponema primitia (strain ATCC BAA-887 / DSM 12427 / ZAS-2) TaxID=545694 RepID=F5YLZ2_TREPZ|nr:AMP-binding protein [Treponema primitia]AEF84773.1 acyl-coenzyme A synthetase ACSM3 [Treponema primitia ZAS-2]